MKSKKPRVSVLVPVYNTEPYLRQCLDSLIGQTMKNIEIVCVDDGSTDGSARILDEYAARDARVRVLHKENGGLPSARNAGLDAAKGEYVGFVDSDDYADREMFRTMYRAAKGKGADIVVCGAIPFPDPPAPEKWLAGTLSPRDKTYDGFSPDVLFREPGARPFLWRDLVRRDLIERNGLRLDEDVVVGEDQAFQCKIFPRAGRVTFLSDRLYYYRHARAGSIMAGARGRADERVLQHLLLFRNVAESLKAAGKLDVCAAALYVWSLRFFHNDLLKLPAATRRRVADGLDRAYEDYGLNGKQRVFGAEAEEERAYLATCSREVPAPLVSVIADATEPRGFEALRRSLDASTEPAFEVLLVNRACPKEDYAALKKYAKEDGRVRLMNYPGGTPKHVAFNECLRVAVGDVIVFSPCGTPLADPGFFGKVLAATLVGAQTFVGGEKALPPLSSFAVSRAFCEENGLRFTDFACLGAERFALEAIRTGKTTYAKERTGFCERDGRVFAPQAATAEGLRAALEIADGDAAETLADLAYGESFAGAMRAVKREERAGAYNALVRLSETVNARGLNRTGEALLPACRDVFPT